MTRPLPFRIQARASAARAGILVTPHGAVPTPAFMPVATQGALRTLPPELLVATGSPMILANAYHLHQRPGEELVAAHGGLHRMMGVDLPILTDSGGFQVFSLPDRRVEEAGVTFTYEVDGRRTFLSPEASMGIQMRLGADIAMAFDECLPAGVERGVAEASVARTTRWARRCKEVHDRADQALFGIIQGGMWPDLRERSAEEIQAIGFDGHAIGGLSVGEGHARMCAVLEATAPLLDPARPRYLMGVGRPLDLVEGVARGIDLFDCVLPTRNARGGLLYTSEGRLRISEARFRRELGPPDPACTCPTCSRFTRAYLHHLFRIGESLGPTLATVHNLSWFAALMRGMREAILAGRFEAFRAELRLIDPEPEAD